MSWASGNKRWTLPFVSLNGTECRVDIYKKNYTGSEVITLTGCAVPIEWSEDDDEDLLNVIRAKTGTLNVIEENYGDLQELYPSLSTDHYIEVYYGREYDDEDDTVGRAKLVFVGFMRAQTFENDWVSGPRELSFNITSPLGLLDGLLFAKPTDPSFKTMGTLLREVIDTLNANIGFVFFPDNDISKTYCMFHMLLSSNVVTPENVEYHYNQTASDLFSQLTFKDFIEGICNCFGLIVHDDIYENFISFVFSRFDYTGKYSRISKYQLSDGQNRSNISVNGATEFDMTTATYVASDDNKESIILPLNKIDINYQGGFFSSKKIPFDHCHRVMSGGTGLVGYSLAVNIPLNNELSSDKLLTNPFLASNGRLSTPGVAFVGLGKDSVQEMILIQTGTGWSTGTPILFKWILTDRPYQTAEIKFNGRYGSSVENLDNPGTTPTIHLYIKCYDKYLVGNSASASWQSTAGSRLCGWGEQSILIGQPPYKGCPIEIWMSMDLQYLDSNYIYTIQDFSLESGYNEFGRYVYANSEWDHQVIQGAVSEVYGSVDCLFTDQVWTANLLSGLDGNGHVSYPENPYNTAYRYLLISQNRLQVVVKGTIPYYAYIMKIVYFNTNWRWRIIAIAFNPIDDEYTITMHRSSTIEQQ